MRKQWLWIIFIPSLFLLIYWQVFFVDYAYLDEIHQLWNNKDQSNFLMFATQGRWLTGIIIHKLFGAINFIEDLKYLRLLSLIGWVFTSMAWYFGFKQWVIKLNLDKRLIPLTTIYLICSLPVAVFIGWASCIELFLAVTMGLLSGLILYNSLYNKKKEFEVSNRVLLISLALGVGSLFLYQNAFGIFLLPFILYYFQKEAPKANRITTIGVFFYLLTYIVYYFLFKYTLQVTHITASDRIGISFDILGKFSFFFSGPLPTSFSLNYIYETGSILPQILAPVMMFLWAISVFIRYRRRGIMANLLFIISILFLLALIYLPSMIAKENFASYRTLLPFNMAVFLLLAYQFFYFINSEKGKSIATVIIGLMIIVLGYYNFNFQFINPLKKEYKAFRSYFKSHLNDSSNTVYFIRASTNFFESFYSIRHAKDEFGAPSTSRDWVPEPLIKQTVFELTGSLEKAKSILVVQYENLASFQKEKPQIRPGTIVIDMNELIRNFNNKSE